MPGFPVQPNPGLPPAVVPLGNGMAALAVVQVDSLGVETSGDTTGVSINAASSVFNGVNFDMGRVIANPVMYVTASGTPSAGIVALQGSLDGTNWYTINSLNATSAPAVVTYANPASGPNAGATPARYLRAIISVAVVGGLVTCTVGGA